jgi:hypothetical protein
MHQRMVEKLKRFSEILVAIGALDAADQAVRELSKV